MDERARMREEETVEMDAARTDEVRAGCSWSACSRLGGRGEWMEKGPEEKQKNESRAHSITLANQDKGCVILRPSAVKFRQGSQQSQTNHS